MGAIWAILSPAMRTAARRHSSILVGPTVVALLAIFSVFPPAAPAQRQPQAPLLVLISIDGLRPDYVTSADAHGARIPNLRGFLRDGTYADGVQGVFPTVTYPSHTTLVTGVWPARHGIWNNVVFDPLRKNDEGWYWYAEDIHVATLWDAAAHAGLTTASIQWPVTVGANITWNIPEYWRAKTPEDDKLLRALSTPGLLNELQPELGPYLGGIDSTIEADEVRGRYAIALLEKKHPRLLTLHLSALDHMEHENGPFSPESMAVLERQDAVIGRIRAAAEHLAPGAAYLAVVSDHGFVRVDHELDLYVPFREAGLITVDQKGKISDWLASPWNCNGSSAVVLKNPADPAMLSRVHALLEKLRSDPANGIDRILEAEEMRARGGFSAASFFVALKPGWKTSTALDGPVVRGVKPGGAHGLLPDLPDLRSAFFLVGPGIPAGRSLGVIDMRDIAPTLAARLGLKLPSADGKNLLP
jgi:predicted AlkP superfamily pyrophosphatase or phosphodiesterase